MSEQTQSSTIMNYDPAVCDLCRSTKFKTILDMPDGSMTSDSQLVESPLRKIQCAGCGLARNGDPYIAEDLRVHYEEDYELGEQAAIAEPLFFTPNGAVPRSTMIFTWIKENLLTAGFSVPAKILEIGCGEGSLLSHFAQSEGAVAAGLDLSGRSVTRARERGLAVDRGSYRDVNGNYDLIYSFAVIEHVPSPSDFLKHLKSHLTAGGLLITAQPCQDTGSYDIFFSDHLHHFFSDHIAQLGSRAGLTEIRRAKNNPYIVDFSLHIFKSDDRGFIVDDRQNDKLNSVPPVSGGERIELDQTISKWNRIFRKLNRWLDLNKEKKLTVWGVGQMFTFLQAYSNLRRMPVAFAFDDNPERFAHGDLGFPVIRFEEATGVNDSDHAILLTFVPGEKVLERLNARSVSYFCPLVNG